MVGTTTFQKTNKFFFGGQKKISDIFLNFQAAYHLHNCSPAIGEKTDYFRALFPFSFLTNSSFNRAFWNFFVRMISFNTSSWNSTLHLTCLGFCQVDGSEINFGIFLAIWGSKNFIFLWMTNYYGPAINFILHWSKLVGPDFGRSNVKVTSFVWPLVWGEPLKKLKFLKTMPRSNSGINIGALSTTSVMFSVTDIW